MRHEKRELRFSVAHLTSPGFVVGRSREELGLRHGGSVRINTDMAVLGFDAKTHFACMVSLHPRIGLLELKENTGFPLHIPKKVPTTALPAAEALRGLREEVDANGGCLR
jgi:glutaconate CoA-transferase, subunit B